MACDFGGRSLSPWVLGAGCFFTCFKCWCSSLHPFGQQLQVAHRCLCLSSLATSGRRGAARNLAAAARSRRWAAQMDAALEPPREPGAGWGPRTWRQEASGHTVDQPVEGRASHAKAISDVMFSPHYLIHYDPQYDTTIRESIESHTHTLC